MSSLRQSPKAAKPKTSVHPGMNVMEIIALHPSASDILAIYGLHCHQCAFNQLDSLEAGAKSHGLTDTDIENMIHDLEEAIASAPPRSALLILTEDAAKALKDIAVSEGKTMCLLRVTSDESGGFCMEFADKAEKDDLSFENQSVKDVALVASKETLARIGGFTVDYREGRFKLDVVKQASCGCDGKGCACEK